MKAGKLLRNVARALSNLPKALSSDSEQKEDELNDIAAQEQKQFPLEALIAATRDFHPKQKLGDGVFGPVYKGKLADGREIAVKKLERGSKQGRKEFANEARLLSRAQHRNVVNLLGYCAHGSQKLLVYEYVANGSLDKVLFDGDEGKQREFDWKRRLEVIVGVMRGLLYLHEDSHCCIIHRDIKASNILLDHKWAPKITDFGMVRLFPEDQHHINTRVASTNGYMAPEYAMYGQLSVKADVFSFGVLVLEIISGKKNLNSKNEGDPQNLLQWAWKLYKKGQALEIMDPILASTEDTDQVSLWIQIGLLCTQSDPNLRPTMRRVVVMLSKKLGALEKPKRPGYPGSRYRRSRTNSSGEHHSHTAEITAISAATSDPNSVTTNTITGSPSPHK